MRMSWLGSMTAGFLALTAAAATPARAADVIRYGIDDDANINRLLHQAEYTAASARGSDIEATAECRTAEAARHLEENIRALASLARFEGLEVTSEGATVRVRATLR